MYQSTPLLWCLCTHLMLQRTSVSPSPESCKPCDRNERCRAKVIVPVFNTLPISTGFSDGHTTQHLAGHLPFGNVLKVGSTKRCGTVSSLILNTAAADLVSKDRNYSDRIVFVYRSG
ncbi:hypothetical protein BJV74DRAFT_66796 [Russula compacta]|nr:hypothetical protein BJV74DRAFT_66796 [Russula compacta]